MQGLGFRVLWCRVFQDPRHSKAKASLRLSTSSEIDRNLNVATCDTNDDEDDEGTNDKGSPNRTYKSLNPRSCHDGRHKQGGACWNALLDACTPGAVGAVIRQARPQCAGGSCVP